MGPRARALDLRKLGITRRPWRSGFGKTLFLQRLVRPTSLTGRLSVRAPGAPFLGLNRREGDLTDTVHRHRASYFNVLRCGTLGTSLFSFYGARAAQAGGHFGAGNRGTRAGLMDLPKSDPPLDLASLVLPPSAHLD